MKTIFTCQSLYSLYKKYSLYKIYRNYKNNTILLISCLMAVQLASAAQTVWFDGTHPITYHLEGSTDPVVKTALDMFRSDMLMVTGMTPEAQDNPQKAKIIIRQLSGTGDGFDISVKKGQIVLTGDNGRGTAYALLEMSRMAGVSPWVWWGDVTPERKNRLTIDSKFHTRQKPSVEYRGIFLNDEDWSLRRWSCENFEPGPRGMIGCQTYKKIFQLLLRLRANAIWPAMHEGTVPFFMVPGAKQMADSCGIVIGTSHCEPLLRNNVGEWNVAERGRFNYKTNRDAVQEYWIQRLKEVSNSPNNMFTIGMRGIHDSSMEGYTTEEEKFDALQTVIDDQQRLLSQYVGDPSKLMQVFVPYKEVLQLYEKGLNVPDYVTLMWCDDNYGYMTRLSNEQEQKRKGGAGLYYHLSYWGRPHDYLWLTTTQPGLICNELTEAHRHNVRRLWIANVHDPKVAGYDLELFLDMAWDINSATPQTVDQHYKAWLCRQFGQQAGEALFPVMCDFYKLCGQRKPEFMGWNQVELDKRTFDRGLGPVRNTEMSTNAFGGELYRYEKAFLDLAVKVQNTKDIVREELHDAFFAAIEYPVYAAAAHALKMLEAQRARAAANGSTGNFVRQDSIAQQASNNSIVMHCLIKDFTQQYNSLKDGKWNLLMCDHPRDLPVFWAPLNPTTGQFVEQANLGYGEKEDFPVDTDGAIARNASQWDAASDGMTVVKMLGHSMNSVAMPKDGTLTYHFSCEKDGEYMLYVALIPTQPNDSGDLRYSITIDNGQPMVQSLKEPFRSEQWKQNVLRGQALKKQKVSLTKGAHSITIHALDAHLVVDQWMIDPNIARSFYLLPL